MVLKRKRKREYYKEFKVVHGVFDEKTLLALYRLLSKTKITVESLVKEGKESVILSGLTPDKKWVAIKVYRVEACEFKKMWRYLIGDPRFKGLKKRKRTIVNLWCKREFKNLKIAVKAGVNCPEPIAFQENILIMSFIGEDGSPAPRLIDVIIEDASPVYKEVIRDLKKLIKSGMVHGDLSAYNILLWDKPYFIDFSHTTTINNQMALELLKRDVKNINSYFSKLNLHLKQPEKVYEELKRLIEKKVQK